MQIKRVAQGAELSLINVKNAFLVSRIAAVHRAHSFLRASTLEGNSTARKREGKPLLSFFFLSAGFRCYRIYRYSLVMRRKWKSNTTIFF